MARRFRFQHVNEDADEPSDLIAHQPTDAPPWWCDKCGTCNDPARHGEWATCLYCGAEPPEAYE